MDLQKLFQMQKVLRDRINYNESDRFNKLVLALLVELGECANEWRGFKFWSKDQEPRTAVYLTQSGKPYKNPLLEEYVDCLHFVLELGLELGIEKLNVRSYKLKNIVNQFNELFYLVGKPHFGGLSGYISLVDTFIGLGVMLGFTQEQIEQAYMDKNKINHERQESGY